MRVVWRSTVRCQRVQTIRTILIGLPFLAVSSNALAQSSTGAPINAATGQSLADAVSQMRKNYRPGVLGAAPAGPQRRCGAAGISHFRPGGTDVDSDALKPQRTRASPIDA